MYSRRKFRSQTSDNMDRWKSRGGKSQRGEEPKREDQRRGKSRNTVFFQWFVALEGRKVGSLKRRERWKIARRCGAKHISKSKCTKHLVLGALLEVEMSKKCMPLWREAHFQVKSERTEGYGALLEVDMSKKCTPLWRQARFQVKSERTEGYGALLEVDMSKKCTPLWREAHFQVKSAKNWGVRSTFGRSDVLLRGRRRGLCTLWKVSNVKACSSFKNDCRRGTFEDDLERCISRGRRSTRDTWVRCVRRSGWLHFGAWVLQAC